MNRSRGTRDAEAVFEILEPRLLLNATFTDSTAAMGLPTTLPSVYLHSGALGDANGDGYLDVFYGTWENQGPNRLYLTNGSPTLTESVQAAINEDPPGTAENGRTSGSVFADFDNDDDLDLIIINNNKSATGVEPNQLLENNGSGIFTDVTSGSGIDVRVAGRNPFVLDYDSDGWLDVLIQDDWFGNTDASHLMRNNHNMTFTDVTAAAGLPTSSFYGIGGAVGDLNGDTYPDILFAGSVAGTSDPNCRLFLNDGDDTFTEYAAANTIFNNAFPLNIPGHGNEDWVCGADFGDLDNDGDIDVVIGHHYGSGFKGTQQISVEVFKNTGNDGSGRPQFTEITAASGVTGLYSRMPHVEIQDFDNDGLMDIWVSNTMEFVGTSIAQPYVLYNTGVSGGNPHFTPPAGVDPPNTKDPFDIYGLQTNPRYLVGGPSGDFDLDGKLDIFAVEAFEKLHYPAIYLNTTASLPNYIDVQIHRETTDGNVFGIGAKVQVYQAGHAGEAAYLLGTNLMEIGNGYVSGRPAIAHFGVPGESTVDVVVTMPNGGPVYTLANATTNQLVTLPVSDTTPPTADITDVTPDPRNTAVSSIEIVFSEAVTGVDLSDFSLTRDGGGDLLTGAQTVGTSDNITWTLGNLSSLTGTSGTYVVTLTALGSGIIDAASNPLAGDASDTWVTDATAPTADVTDVTPDPRNSAVSSIDIVFSEAVTGVDLSDLSLKRDGGGNLLTGSQTLGTSDNITWTLGNLSSLTGASGTYVVTLTALGSGITDALGNPLAGDASDTWVTDATAPTVTAEVINRGSPIRSKIRELAFTFSEDVTVAVGDLTLYNHTTSSNADLTGISFSYNGTTHVATWDLNALATDLTNAYYTATLSATNITDGVGNHLDGDGNGTGGDDYTYLVLKLAGDANGDASVNVGDLGILGFNYGQCDNWWELPGDMNLDGCVNVGDLGILGYNYGTTLTPPPSGGLLGEGASGGAQAGAVEPAVATAQGVEGQRARGIAVRRSEPAGPTPAARTMGADILSPRAAGASARPIRTTISSPTPDDAAGEQAFDALALSSPAAPAGR